MEIEQKNEISEKEIKKEIKGNEEQETEVATKVETEKQIIPQANFLNIVSDDSQSSQTSQFSLSMQENDLESQIQDPSPISNMITTSTTASSTTTSISTSSNCYDPDAKLMLISWKEIVKEYVKRYDEVFCLTSAKAHLDICDLVVDGAKEKWR